MPRPAPVRAALLVLALSATVLGAGVTGPGTLPAEAAATGPMFGTATGTASAAATPKPTTPATPTLPIPRATVDPRLSVGGERLASMGVVVDLPPGVPAPPELEDVSWLLADLETGAVVAAKAPHARLLPASTLKVLTALTLIPRLDAARSYPATAQDAAADGTRVGLLPGQPYTGEQLFSALLMSSGNDAAYALARVAGGREATLAAMNEQARLLGAHDTVAGDPAGLDAPGQTSSAYDLALIGRAAMELPDFRRYVTTRQIEFPGRQAKNGKRSTYAVGNHNKLLYNYPGTIGIKNGYTEAARRTFISAVTRGGRTYLLTEMHGLNHSWRPQAAMYDWAFAHGHRVTPVGRLVEPGTVTTAPTLAPTSPPAATATVTAGGGPETGSPAGTGVAGTTGATPEPRGGQRDPAAAIPSGLTGGDGLAPWVGLTGLAAAGLLVALLAGRTRTRRDH